MKTPVKKALGLLLAASLLLSLAGCMAPDTQTPAPSAEPTAEVTPAPAPTAAPTPAPTAEPAAPEPTAKPFNGETIILYTSDVHSGVDQGFGYAGLAAVRDYLKNEGFAVMLVDDGDSIQGEPIGTFTKGEAIVELMNQVGYDLAIPGNHEFDYGVDNFLSLVEKADFPYLCCNFFRSEGERLLTPYKLVELGGRKIGFVGAVTPNTISSSMPKIFTDEEGNFIYDFKRSPDGEAFYACVQEAVDAVRAEGAELVVLMAHLGNNESGKPTYADTVSHVKGLDVVLDGHSHDAEQVSMKDSEGRTVLRSACGTKLENIGWCRIDKDGAITTGLYRWQNDVAAPELLGIHNETREAVDAALSQLDDTLEVVVAKTAVDLTINDPVEKGADGKPVRMVRRAETNIGDLCADAIRDATHADFAVVNGGGVRSGIDKGDITFGQILSVHPFGNEVCIIEVTGQQILDMLEWAVHAVPDELGAFLQVSGISFEVHSYLPSPCQKDDMDAFVSVSGERRVRNVLVGGEPLDPAATYTVGGHDHTLLNLGGGYQMLEGAKVISDSVKLDNQALTDYITQTLGGTIGADYEEPTGQGRIVIYDTQPEA